MSQRQRIYDLLQPTIQALQAVYSSNLSVAQKREHKEAIFNQAREQYAAIEEELPYWRPWIDGLNNARLTSLSDYTRGISVFEQVFTDCAAQWSCFYQRTDEMAKKADEVFANDAN